MLVLTGRADERIVAGNIVITVVRISGSHCRIGISAPESIPIVRGELLDGSRVGRPITPPAPKGPRSRDGRPRTGRWRDWPGNGGGSAA